MNLVNISIIVVLIALFFIVRRMKSDPFNEGIQAYNHGKAKYSNPYQRLTQKEKFIGWSQGWTNAREQSGHKNDRYWV